MCGYDWNSPTRHAVATIHGLPVLLASLLRNAEIEDGDQRLRARPSPEVWSPLEYIAHTGDAVDWYSGRVTRVLTEHPAQLEAFDWDRHTGGQAYHRRHLDDVLGDVHRACKRFRDLTANLAHTDWQRKGIGSDGTPRTTAQLTHRAAHEAHHHLHDIRTQLTN